MRFEMIVLSSPDNDGHRYSFCTIDDARAHDHAAFKSVRAWCVDHFGEAPTDRCAYPGSRWVGIQYFYFRDEDDAMLFRLRWC